MRTAADSTVVTSPEYRRFIEELKARVNSARISAARAVNRDGLRLYCDIGRRIVEFLQQVVAEVPWGQNLLILNKLTAPAARLWYLRATAHFGWTRNVLLNLKGKLPTPKQLADVVRSVLPERSEL